MCKQSYNHISVYFIEIIHKYLLSYFSEEQFDLSFSKMLKLSNELLGETLFFWNKLFDKQEDIGETRGADFSDNDGCQFVSSRKGQKLKIRNI